MPLDDTGQQALVVLEAGDLATTAFPSGVVAGNIAAIWSLYSDKVYAYRLQFFYAKLHALGILEGAVREQVNFAQAGVLQESASDKLRGLLEMAKATEARIQTLEREAKANRSPAVGRITATAPVMPTDDAANPFVQGQYPFDANSTILTGSPYIRPWVWR